MHSVEDEEEDWIWKYLQNKKNLTKSSKATSDAWQLSVLRAAVTQITVSSQRELKKQSSLELTDKKRVC